MKKHNKNKFYFCMLLIPLIFFIASIKFNILPAKYFYDSRKILFAVLNNGIEYDKAYNFAIILFKTINIFHFTTLQEWNYFFSIIFTILLIRELLKKDNFSFTQYIFILASFVLLNIYVFGITKDIIQFVFFLFIYYILKHKKWSNLKKLILSCFILLIEAVTFRIYYAIMAMLMITIYIIYEVFIKNKNVDKKKTIKILIIALFAFFMEIFVVKLLSSDNYNAIINARYSVNIYRNNDIDAITIINDLLGVNYTYLLFIGNYFINAIRMLFPLELLFKGIKYIPFIIYQFFISVNVIKLSKNLNPKNILWFACLVSFLMVSIIFEPDFGSFIRHESTIILIMLEMTFFNKKKVNNNEKN